jgi:transcriptional regulator with XRE-family HTH domain
LAEKLGYIRYRLELTQEELKKRIEQLGFVSNLDRADVSDFERGRRDPDLLTLLAYARLANVYLDVLVDDGLDLPEELPSPHKHEGTKHVESDKKTNTQSGAVRHGDAPARGSRQDQTGPQRQSGAGQHRALSVE